MCQGIETKYIEGLGTQCKVFFRVYKKSEPDRRFPQDIEITLYKVSVKLPLRIEKAENPLLVNVNIHHQLIGNNLRIQPKNPDNITVRIKLLFHIDFVFMSPAKHVKTLSYGRSLISRRGESKISSR